MKVPFYPIRDGRRGFRRLFRGALPVLLVVLIAIMHLPLHANQTALIETTQYTIIFDESLRRMAEGVPRSYEKVINELEAALELDFDLKPTVVLIEHTDIFQKIARNPIFVALAIPGRNEVIIDASRVNARTDGFRNTLKHELCHLLLHSHIPSHRLPRWLDEGVCQWVSQGVSEIEADPGRRAVGAAGLARRRIPFDRITAGFPKDDAQLLTAYDQSRSLITYVVRKYGPDKVPAMLFALKESRDPDKAIFMSLSRSFAELEDEWLLYLEGQSGWFSLFSANIYGILFFIGGIATVWGFIRYWRKKKNYPDEDLDFYQD